MPANPANSDNIDVAYVANLARLELTEAEIREYQGQLNHVLEYFREIREIELSAVEPTAHAAAVHNVFRKDEPREGLSRDKALANAPAQADDQFAVPKIVE